jgi:hypothetical protein
MVTAGTLTPYTSNLPDSSKEKALQGRDAESHEQPAELFTSDLSGRPRGYTGALYQSYTAKH